MTTDPRTPVFKTDLLCAGNAIVDVFAEYSYAQLDRLGITEPAQHIDRARSDAIMRELGFSGALPGPAPGGISLSSGGGAANVAKIAAMLGMNAAFAGAVGPDPLAAVFEKDLRDAGVTPLLARGKEKTGTCLILSEGGKTRIAATPGAALEFTGDDVVEDMVAGAGAVVLDGYILDRRPLVQRLLRLADKHGIPAAIDAASVFHIREKTEEIVHYCRNYPLMVFMNADESIVFYNTIKKSRSEEEISGEQEKEALILRDICPALKCVTEGELFPIIVIKLGGRGAVVLAGGNIYRAETFAIMKPKDAIGAGDAFCAAFLSAWIRGKSLSECAALGNKVARRILEVPGTHIGEEKLRNFAKQLRPRN
jgi:sugar/nucleoside kinase (ribokinase family)